MHSGLAVLLRDGDPLVTGRRIGLLTHPAAVDAELRSAVDRMAADPRWQLVALFGPEHGIRGDAQAGEPVAGTADPATGLPVHSLYGAMKVPTPAMLAGLDTIVVDLQDAGVRYFTYPATVLGVIEAAASAGVAVLILDRPAPLGGALVEGGGLQPGLRSLVGVHDVPIRHGLTLGELCRLVAGGRGLPLPAVVRMEGWSRAAWCDETGLPWIAPSPNLPTLDALTLYPGTCLLEGTNLSEGRGTTRPFEQVGAPWFTALDPQRFADAFNERGCAGVRARPTTFVPTFSKHAGLACGGIQLHVTDRLALRPTEVGLAVIATARALSGTHLEWRDTAFDRLAGDPAVRETLAAGADPGPLVARWRAYAERFSAERAPWLLYPLVGPSADPATVS